MKIRKATLKDIDFLYGLRIQNTTYHKKITRLLNLNNNEETRKIIKKELKKI
jgi:hypothetical protein